MWGDEKTPVINKVVGLNGGRKVLAGWCEGLHSRFYYRAGGGHIKKEARGDVELKQVGYRSGMNLFIIHSTSNAIRRGKSSESAVDPVEKKETEEKLPWGIWGVTGQRLGFLYFAEKTLSQYLKRVHSRFFGFSKKNHRLENP